MKPARSYDERLQNLRSVHAKELLQRVQRLRAETQSGKYNDENLAELSAILRDLRSNFVGNDTRLSEIIGVSGRSISDTYSGRNKPRYTNFMKMLSGAELICSREARFPGSQGVNSSNSGEIEFLSKWNADWVAVDANQELIADVISSLERLVVFAGRSNISELGIGSSNTLTQMQKDQLIRVLETALAMLKSPMVEKGFLRRVGLWLFKIGQKAAEQEAQSALENAAGHGSEILNDLIKNL